jgi:hypothetical protein
VLLDEEPTDVMSEAALAQCKKAQLAEELYGLSHFVEISLGTGRGLFPMGFILLRSFQHAPLGWPKSFGRVALDRRIRTGSTNWHTHFSPGRV